MGRKDSPRKATGKEARGKEKIKDPEIGQ